MRHDAEADRALAGESHLAESFALLEIAATISTELTLSTPKMGKLSLHQDAGQ